ncbi:MAG: hypothetical protein QOD07_854 [Frankiaceae bacterium]|nr:hypothetical protein [Frankiaceae bacterium]
MWNLSYGQVAAAGLDAARVQASYDALIAQLPAGPGGPHRIRRAVGELLIRAGARLVMPSTPSTAR